MAAVDLQPTLTGQHVVIRPLQAEDWIGLYAAAADPLIWEMHPASDRYLEPVFRYFFDVALAAKSAFAFLDRKTGRIIGSSRYHGHDRDRGEIEIGWTFLARDCWGGAYNREIKRLMIDHAFGFVTTVIFMVGETNVRSRRAVEKIGGVQRSEVISRPLNGIVHDHVVYEIRKETWEAI